jgi:hypothetical protein
MTREAIELALDRGELFILTTNKKIYRVRRHGKTKLWKTRPNEFRIPIKFMSNGTATITHNDANADWLRIMPQVVSNNS